MRSGSRAEAQNLGDDLGVTLAERVLANPIERPELEDLPKVTTIEMWPI